MRKVISLSSLLSVLFLIGCSSMSDQEFMLAQGEDPSEQTFNAHLREWQKLKPEIYELVKMKKELKSLINDLNELADDTEKEQLTNSSKNTYADQETINPMPQKVVMPTATLVNSMVKDPTINKKIATAADIKQNSSTVSSAEGQFAIQLGSFSNMIYVKRIWNKVKNTFPQIMLAKTPRSETVQIANNQTLFRLKVGSYATKNDAKEVCELLIAQQQICIATSLSGETF
ncbi:MAG: cell division protein FtsN [Alteromonadaceae bacterium]|jgi:cell division protein FtsN